MASIAKQRRVFEKELLAALGSAVKGTGWKKSGHILFRESDGFFHEIRISVFLNDEKIRVTQQVKPMALDLILWDILGISENAGEPLSFRATGVFTCSGLPIYEEFLDGPDVTVSDAVIALVWTCGTKMVLCTWGCPEMPRVQHLKNLSYVLLGLIVWVGYKLFKSMRKSR